MLTVLRIDKSGMESLSLFKSGLVRWMYGGDLEKVVLKTGEIGAFQGQNLDIRGNNAEVSREILSFTKLYGISLKLIYKEFYSTIFGEVE